MVYRIISSLIGYLIGNIMTGYLLAKAKNIDLRKEGSGNLGTTNTLRTLGVKTGAITFLFDCLKSVLSALIVFLIFRNSFEDVRLLMLYASFGCVLGHDFPIIMKFKGGKGIASSLGLALICMPIVAPVSLAIFIVTVATTRYVSLGSILAAITFSVQVIIFGFMGLLPFEGSHLAETMVIGILIGAIAVFLHRSNIERLKNGCENKFSFHPNTKV